RCKGPTCAILVLSAMGAVLPAAPFSGRVSNILGHLLAAAVVVVIGWTVMNTLDLFADLYVSRIKYEVDSNNLLARKHLTQVGILRTAIRTLLVLLTIGLALMTSSAVRQYGVSLFASAGAAGLVVGLAARPLLSNLLAGIQIGLTQPIRLEDSVVVQGEWGWIERIGATYVVIRIWDLRRLIVPLSYFIEQPFQNWTHSSADLMGTVMLYVDYSVPVAKVREKLQEVVKNNPKWDGKVAGVQMTDLPNTTVELRLLVSARNAGVLWDLRCDVREAMVTWLVEKYPDSLPRRRMEVGGMPERMSPARVFADESEETLSAGPVRL
ncbi:MAG: mechanosensitive ion channel, partial [Rhodospirillales bacterium]|nr:mechanosensitive ion channel [Rhodospirillales bacterium]